jgi:hypothetical protein
VKVKLTAAFILMMFGARPGLAQQAPQAADSARYRERAIALRDTVHAVSRELVSLRRDLRSAGPETVLSKANGLNQACREVRAALLDGLPAFAAREVPVYARAAADTLRLAIRDLTRHLQEHCVVGLDPRGPGQAADTIRAWGPYRTAELRRGIERFQGRVASFARAARFKLPIGGR